MEGRIVRKGRVTHGRRNPGLAPAAIALAVALLVPAAAGAASGTVARPAAATRRVSLTARVRLAPGTAGIRMTAVRETGCCA
jgi:hypothetical protein